MALLPTIGRVLGTGVASVRLLLRGTFRSGRWVTRRIGAARTKGAAGEAGMVRLFDLHAASCAGDVLVTIGLAGTIFFSAPLGEARGKVALYLLITMVPFALLAPVVGPLLDHFRHGRRYALAATMLGRAFLAWMISDNLDTFGLYPAAFGVLALSRAYGVARAAAVPRLLPEGIGLSQVGARSSLYGTFASAVVAPIGLAAFWLGPQWPLRVSSIFFIIGMVIALKLPPRADSDPPETVPAPWKAALRRPTGDRPLSGRLVIAMLIGCASLRAMYGFLLLFLAFVIKSGSLDTKILAWNVSTGGAVATVGAALAVGTFLSTAIGTRLRIHRPIALQSSGLIAVAAAAVLATVAFSLLTVAILCLVTATFAGVAKLAIDACISERIPERLRASAFAHSETVLMLAWVAGGGVGLIPLSGRVGVGIAAGLISIAAVQAAIMGARLHGERLHGRPETAPDDDPDPVGPPPSDPTPTGPAQPGPPPKGPAPTDPTPARPEASTPERTTTLDPTAVDGFAVPGTGDEATTARIAPVSPSDDTLAPPGFHIYRPGPAGEDRAAGDTRRGRSGP